MGVVTRVGVLDLIDDLQPAAWLTAALPVSYQVRSLVSDQFDAYARILHPPGGGLTWARVATTSGATPHSLMQWEHIVGNQDVEEPLSGALEPAKASLVVDALTSATTTPESCWFGLWDGYGQSLIPEDAAPTFAVPLRDMYLLHGPIAGLTMSLAPSPLEQFANCCWPDDHAWLIANDVDLRSTYVGGSRTLIHMLTATEGLEAYTVAPDDRISLDSDTINDCADRQGGTTR